MQTVKLIEWLKKEGDRVEKGKPVAVVEGEKTTFEVESPESGILHKTLYAPGSDVPVGKPIALIAVATESQR
jgi:pyruvate dehydrogenase E2 component (dihydrolipoamide acetyltransferase)